MRETKLHYKMYKAGKQWMFAAVATAIMGTAATAVTTHADTTSAQSGTTTSNKSTDGEATNPDVQSTNDSSNKIETAQQVSLPSANENKAETNTSNNDVKPENAVQNNNDQADQKSDQSNQKNDSNVENNNDATAKNQVDNHVVNANVADTPQVAQPKDVSVSVNVSPQSDSYTPGEVVSYTVGIQNNSTTGSVIPAGTTINLNFSNPTNDAMSKFLTYVNSNYSENLYVTQNSANSFSITTTDDMYPGFSNITLNFRVEDPGWNWDGKDNADSPAMVSSNASVSYQYGGQTNNVSFTGSQINVKPFPKAQIDPNTKPFPGYSTGNYNGQNFPNDNFPAGNSNYVGSSNDKSNVYTTSVKDKDGNPYVATVTNLNPFVRGDAKVKSISTTSELPIGNLDQNVHLYFYDTLINGGTWVDITDLKGLVWNKSQNYVYVDVSNADFDGTGIGSNANGYALVVWTPITNDNVRNTSTSSSIQWYELNGKTWNTEPTTANFVNNFTIQPSGDMSTTPYFSGKDVTIYQNQDGQVTFNPLNGVSAHSGKDGDLTNKINITNYDGYPKDGVNPAVGTYTIEYSVDYVDADGKNQTKTFTRNITVLANEAKVTAHDVTIHTGDAIPSDASAYGASAVGKDGKTPVAITSVNTKDVNNQVIGDYPVTITDADGVSTKVTVHVIENKASISGHDVTIYAGDAKPDASAFGASATDEDGKAIDVTVDTSNVNNEVAGTYPVKITAADGKTKVVNVIVLAVKEPAKTIIPSTHVTPEQPTAPQPNEPSANSEAPAPTKPAEAPKQNALPQTGQNATASLMSIIGMILLSIFGFFGIDGLKKKINKKL